MVATSKKQGAKSKAPLKKNQPKPNTSKTKIATAPHDPTYGLRTKKPPKEKGGVGRGGARPGSGRKPGSHNKRTQELLDNIASTGQTPLEFMIEQMRNAKMPMAARLQAARDAAPFVHSKMQSIEISGPDGAPIEVAKIPVDPAEAMAAYKDLMG